MARKDKAFAPAKSTKASKNKRRANPSSSAPSSATQCRLILKELIRAGARGRTTIELRHNLGVMHPAARVLELRDSGTKIITRRDIDTTPDGINHRVARYVLIAVGGAV